MRRLTKALVNPKVREIMNIEDDIIEELSNRERRIEDLVQEKNDAIKQAQQAKQREQQAKQREQQAKQREQQAKQREQQAKQREQQAKQREQQAKQREQQTKQQIQEVKQQAQQAELLLNREREEKKNTKLKLAKMMKKIGISTDEIIKETGLTVGEIEEL